MILEISVHTIAWLVASCVAPPAIYAFFQWVENNKNFTTVFSRGFTFFTLVTYIVLLILHGTTGQ